ncbi:MAG TPA: DUF1931 domain-containing protein [Candidatus Thermoplasmatota archaeon]|nr:DUF1931 domain-containing protein [Candidatus Thermoplasmatota archaeon]
MLVNETRVREALDGYRLNHRFTRAIEERLLAMLDTAKKRAEENGRRTLYPHDL